MPDLNHLPYEIIQLILEQLDTHTLLNVALASHALNEMASLPLYRSIAFNLYIPYKAWNEPEYKCINPTNALQRRPSLRSVVQSVTICSTHVHFLLPIDLL